MSFYAFLGGKMEKYDLHIHSIYSDGEYTPQQIIDRLIECGIGIFSITDHDNLNTRQFFTEMNIV